MCQLEVINTALSGKHYRHYDYIKHLLILPISPFDVPKEATRVAHYEEIDRIRSLEYLLDYESIKDKE